MPIYDNNGTTNYEIASLTDYNGTTYSQIGTVYDYNGTTSSVIFSAEYTVLEGATSNAGSPSIVIYDSGDGRSTNLSSAGWRVQGNGRVCAALANKVTLSGYSYINFTVTANDVFISGSTGYAALGYRTDSKTWINAMGVSVSTKTVISTYGQTGTFQVAINSSDASGYIIVEEMSQGSGISSSCGLTISKIWLS